MKVPKEWTIFRHVPTNAYFYIRQDSDNAECLNLKHISNKNDKFSTFTPVGQEFNNKFKSVSKMELIILESNDTDN